MRLLLTMAALAIYISCYAQTVESSAPTQENSETNSSTVTTEKVTNQGQISESKVRKPRASKATLAPVITEKKETENELPDLREKK